MRSIVHADRPGQAVATKYPGEHRAHRGIAGGPHMAHEQNLATIKIAHRQRLDPGAVSGAEPAFEVNRPHVIGSVRQLPVQRRQARPRPGAMPTRHARSPALQGARMRQGAAGPVLAQRPAQLARPPGRVRATQLLHRQVQPARPTARQPPRTTRSLLQSPASALFKALPPFIAGLAADAMFAADPCKASIGVQHRFNKRPPWGLLGHFFPRHMPWKKCHPCLAANLLPMSRRRASRL